MLFRSSGPHQNDSGRRRLSQKLLHHKNEEPAIQEPVYPSSEDPVYQEVKEEPIPQEAKEEAAPQEVKEAE